MSLVSRHIPTCMEFPQWVGKDRWDYVSPDVYSPERQLRLMDREMQHLASEMNRYCPDLDLHLRRENAKLFKDSAQSQPLIPRSWFTETSFMNEMQRKLREQEAKKGVDSHAENWRLKENFHIDNPVVKDESGQRQYRLQFDLCQFKPEEIVVRTVGQQLNVQARHEESGEGRKVHREYFRQCTIPENVNPETLVSRLSHSGILTIQAPLPSEEDKIIPISITHTGS